MARVKRGVTGHAKHKKVLKAAKGYYGRRKNTIRIAKQAVEKANQYAFRDRKRRKRTFRALWIQRLNAAVREFGLTYSRFIDGLARRASWSIARCFRISRSGNRRRSKPLSTRPRPRWRLDVRRQSPSGAPRRIDRSRKNRSVGWAKRSAQKRAHMGFSGGHGAQERAFAHPTVCAM